MGIRWLTAFIDRPANVFDSAVRFWTAATGSSRSAFRGDRGQFATLSPVDGHAYLRVQRVDADRGSHLDLHVDDVDRFTRQAVAAGAEPSGPPEGVRVLRSPAGLPCCVVGYYGESVRPRPLMSPGGAQCLVDQLCIDIPGDRFDEECEFWANLTGWELRSSSVRREFKFLTRPAWSPLRLLLQRRDDADGPARAHLDFASDEVDGLVRQHETLGASVAGVFDHWTVMNDPAGHAYCITSRDPRTGVLPLPH